MGALRCGGFQLKAVLARGGGISIIGVVRAPVAIIDFTFFARDLLVEFLDKLRDFHQTQNKWIATGARTTPTIEIPPPPPPDGKTPFGNSGERSFQLRKRFGSCTRRKITTLGALKF